MHSFPKGINQQPNVMARLEFELVYNDVAVQHVRHYITGTTHSTVKVKMKIFQYSSNLKYIELKAIPSKGLVAIHLVFV